jgi:hypothetical protein
MKGAQRQPFLTRTALLAAGGTARLTGGVNDVNDYDTSGGDACMHCDMSRLVYLYAWISQKRVKESKSLGRGPGIRGEAWQGEARLKFQAQHITRWAFKGEFVQR